MRKPNLFIVGGPRSGTTALYTYLGSHPDVFMCPRKEPHYFSFDMNRWRAANTEEEYLRLFENAHETIVGEASCWYLYSKVAIPEIMHFNPQAKIIAIVRNPVDWLRSWHAKRIFTFQEDEPDIEIAWRKQEARASGRDIPRNCREPELLQYRTVAMFGEQIERALKIIPAKQFKIIVYDDFINSRREIYESVLSFLSLPLDGRTDFPTVNEVRRYRSLKLARNLIYPSLPAKAFFKASRFLQLENEMKRTIKSWNEISGYGQQIQPEFRKELVEVFRSDVEKLGRILNRDLSHWLLP
jgi:hypothetical protein